MRILIIALTILLLHSCSNKTEKKLTERIAFKQSPLDSAYSRLRPQVQTFRIDNKTARTIKAAKGTEIFVPANSFIDGNGNSIAGPVDIEVVEAFSLHDFITSGLATRSGNQLLLSNGMMFINAKNEDGTLQLADGMSLTVSMPAMNNNLAGFQMFTGDGTDWKVDSSMTELDYSIPLPLDLLYPEGNEHLWHCYTHDEDGREWGLYYDTTILTFTDRKYENTVIATHEFGLRVAPLIEMMYNMSYLMNRPDLEVDHCEEDRKYNYDIFKVYYDHPRRSFKESDSVARKLYVDYINKHMDELKKYFNDVNEYKRRTTIYLSDSGRDFFDFSKSSMEEQLMKPVKDFPPDTREIKMINDYGINLDSPDAYTQLAEKGLDKKEINDILAYNFRRQALISKLRKVKEGIVNKKKVNDMYESTVFSVKTMGWINCDRFYDDPEAGKAEMYVSNTGNKLDFVDWSLVIPDMNVKLSAFPDSSGSYSFTPKDATNTKLPIGRNAVIVGVSIRNDSLFFASSKIKIKDGLKVNLPMKYMGKEELKGALESALN